jgi:O-antigen ligase
MDSGVVLFMSIWLLRIANSATALACTVVGIAVYLATGFGFIKARLRNLEIWALAGGVGWWLGDSVLHLNELVVRSLGRDMTLTTRTDAWQLFLSMDLNPMVGAGFKSFWAGDRMAQIWRDFPGIVQAHNGYIETYLEGGFLGLLFLTILLFSSFRNIKRQLVAGEEYGRLRLAFWVVAIIYNFSEAAFSQLSLLWIVTLLVMTEVPQPIDGAAPKVVTDTGAATRSRVVSPWRPVRAAMPAQRPRLERPS